MTAAGGVVGDGTTPPVTTSVGNDVATTGRARPLVRAASGSLVLNLVNTAATVLATIILARVMDLAAFGTYAWVVAVVTLLTVPAVLGLDRVLVRDVAIYAASGSTGKIRGLLIRASQLVLVTTLAIVVGVAAMVAMTGSAEQRSFLMPLALGLVALPLLAYGRLVQSFLIGLHRVVVAQVPDLLVRPVALLIGVAALVIVGARLAASEAVLLYTMSAGLSLAVAALYLRKHSRPLRGAAPEYESRRWLVSVLTLALIGGGQLINTQIGTVMLGVLDMPAAAGLYSVAQRGAMLIAFPLMALGAAIAPTAARLWAERRVGELQRLVTLGTRGVLLASVPIALVFLVAGESILTIVFGADYAAAAPALAILTLGQLGNAATGTVATLLIMAGKTGPAAVGLSAGIGLNVWLALLLIPGSGSTGAAVAAAAGLIVSNLIHVVIAWRTLGIDTSPVGYRAARRRPIAG